MASWSQSTRNSLTRCTCPELSPLRHSAPRERLKYQASPLAIVRRSASAFMCATIRTSPDVASVVTQVTSPSASNFGDSSAPSSTSWVEPRGGKDEEDMSHHSHGRTEGVVRSLTHRARTGKQQGITGKKQGK